MTVSVGALSAAFAMLGTKLVAVESVAKTAKKVGLKVKRVVKLLCCIITSKK